MDLWVTERQTDGVGLTCKVNQTLHSEQTRFQRLDVVETAQFGRMLLLDGMVQTTILDEFVYHEMITHVAMQTHPNPRKVVVIGGGDGGAVREIVKYPSVQEVKLVEIDERVVWASKTYFPEISLGLDDPRVECLYEDGIQHIQRTKGYYDLVIVDSTEPVGPAVGLFGYDFYAACKDSLTQDGILVAQTESPYYNSDILSAAYARIQSVFPLTRLYLAAIPTYPSGLWSFTLGSKGPDPLKIEPDLAHIPTKYYTEALHRCAFTLPRFVESMISSATEGSNNEVGV